MNTSTPDPDTRALIALRSAKLLPVVFRGVSRVIGPKSLKVTPSLPQITFDSLNLLVQLVPVEEASPGPVLRNTGCKSRVREPPGCAQGGGGGTDKSALMVALRLGARA